MDAKKPYVIAIVVQLIYAGMFVVSKAAFDHGMNTYVFIFYRQAAASLLLLPIALLLERYLIIRIMLAASACIYNSFYLLRFERYYYILSAGRMCVPCRLCCS